MCWLEIVDPDCLILYSALDLTAVTWTSSYVMYTDLVCSYTYLIKSQMLQEY